MRCEQIKDLLSPYVDEVTSEKENKMVEAHLAVCTECRKEVEGLQRLSAMLGKLQAPDLPPGFSDDLHRRLLEEKTTFFGPRKIRQPRKQSWIAASVAAVAVAVGIFASSVLPVGSLVAWWQDRDKEQTRKPSVAIHDLIQRIYEQPLTPDVTEPGTSVIPDPAAPVKPGNTGGSSEPVKVADNEPDKVPSVQVQPRYSDNYTTRIFVQDAGTSTDKVIQLAEARGISYNTSGAQEITSLSGNRRSIALKVNRNQVDEVLGQLKDLGETNAPLHNTIEVTDQFQEVEENLAKLQQEREKLAGKEGLSAEEQTRLQDLNGEIVEWNKKKAALEKDSDMVTININLVENGFDH